ncbi:MAG: helix-turn-helix domain-containing protein, partial [Ruminiclostridium sp.]|nr:helix-turn-helix domain-containing protein [Ruminiclostridium sp.]
MKTIKIQEVIKEKRLERNLSQEALAEAFDISVQAVSKWENALSYPDITVLPKICDYFNISMDALFFGEKCGLTLTELPDDGMYRVVQCVGKRVIGADEWDEEKKIPLLIPDDPKAKINMEIWGSADIEGDIDGSVKAGKVINCGGVDGSVEA